MKNKEIKDALIEMCRNIEYIAHNCADHLKVQHKIAYTEHPYFDNIEIRMREFRQKLEKEAKPSP